MSLSAEITIGDDEVVRLRNLRKVRDGQEDELITEGDVTVQVIDEEDSLVFDSPMTLEDALTATWVGDLPASSGTELLVFRDEYRLVAVIVIAGKRNTISLDLVTKRGSV